MGKLRTFGNKRGGGGHIHKYYVKVFIMYGRGGGVG